MSTQALPGYDGKEELRRIFLIGIDEILDTRLGTLKQHFPKVFEQYLKTHVNTGLYHRRRRDEFGPISYEQFREKYALRNLETLKHSLISNSELFLTGLISDAFKESVAEPMRGFPHIYINTYPYELSEDLRKAFFVTYTARLAKYFGQIPVIGFIHKNMTELTALYCHNHFKGMIMYDLNDWMNAQAENFKKTLLPHTTAITPALFRDTAEDNEEVQSYIARGVHPLKMWEFAASKILPVTMVDVKLFSIFGHMTDDLTPEALAESAKPPRNESPVQEMVEGRLAPDPRDFNEPEPKDLDTNVRTQIQQDLDEAAL